jgi:hypothetical protein
MKHRWLLPAFAGAALAAALAACAPAATQAPAPTTAPERTEPAVEGTVVQTQAVEATSAPAATQSPARTATPAPFPGSPTPAPSASAPGPTATALIEPRVVELEWPPRMRLGESDVVRLSLVPVTAGYEVVTEFEDHTTLTQTVQIEQLAGYELWGVARLDGAGFGLSPSGDLEQRLLAATTTTWRWTLQPANSGRQRLSVLVRLRWIPLPANPHPAREVTLYDRALTIQVLSFLGMTAREAAMLGVAGLAFGSTLSLPLAVHALKPRRRLLQVLAPNPALLIERAAGISLSPHETDLLRALFQPYGRVVLEAEFRSGYSGARTFLALPLRPDGRADAYTIAKLGSAAAIRQEYENYETFVKDTLPPVTARIQSVPVTLRGAERRAAGIETRQAALRYTFIGEPGRSPKSLRQALLDEPDPTLLENLFATFGPNWWRQRRPYTFRLAREYDRMLPTHFVVEPLSGARPKAVLDDRVPPPEVTVAVGDVVVLRNLTPTEVRPDGRSLALSGAAAAGHPPLRVRWLSLAPPEGAVGRIVATRDTLLREFIAGFDLLGLQDPLPRVPAWLAESVSGSQATIHGDLNIENVLVGPGGFVWLIDFAQTRDGHPLFDFAHLEAGLIAHVISPSVASNREFLGLLAPGAHPLLSAMRRITNQCLFNPAAPREYDLALAMACLGSLKYANLDRLAKHRLYLTAAHIATRL